MWFLFNGSVNVSVADCCGSILTGALMFMWQTAVVPVGFFSKVSCVSFRHWIWIAGKPESR